MINPRQEFEQLVAANRILAYENVVDAFGHVSIRHPENPHRFVMSRSRAPSLVEFDDLMEFEFNGDPVDSQARSTYGERVIHGAIMEVRPEINVVIHNHAPEILPFTITGNPLRPVIHSASVIGEQVPIWDIRDNFGESTDMLVRSVEQGRDLASALGKNTCILMRGHGATIAGSTVQEAVAAAVYLQLNARVLSMGHPIPLTSGEIAGHNSIMLSPLGSDRMWEYFCVRAGFKPC